MKTFTLLIATNNLSPMEYIIAYLSKSADNVQIVHSLQETLSLISTGHVTCMVCDTAFLVEQNNQELLRNMMGTSIPSVTLIRRADMRFFDQVYDPPVHDYAYFPVDLEHISLLLYRVVGQFGRRVPESEALWFIEQQFRTAIADYPTQHVQFTYAAITIPCIALLEFTQKIRNEPFSKYKYSTSFRGFCQYVENSTRSLVKSMEAYLHTTHHTLQSALITHQQPFNTQIIASYHTLKELLAQTPRYTRELQRAQRGTYQPQRAVPRDIELITAILRIVMYNTNT